MRRIVYLILVLMLILSLSIYASAAVKDEMVPLYDNINTIYAYTSVDESTGIVTATGKITANNTYSVKVFVNLQVYKNGSWQTLASWSESGTMNVSCSNRYAVSSGYNYRTQATGYVYDSNGNILESASATHTAYYPSN